MFLMQIINFVAAATTYILVPKLPRRLNAVTQRDLAARLRHVK